VALRPEEVRVIAVALGTLVAWTSFVSWKRRAAFVIGAALVSVLANGARAWGTIYVAQFVGAKRAGGFDHIVYGWVFFAIVVTTVLAIAWRFFQREPVEAGLTAEEADARALDFGEQALDPTIAMIAIIVGAIVFAALSQLV
jgi:exosortase/archaeosortase family protein